MHAWNTFTALFPKYYLVFMSVMQRYYWTRHSSSNYSAALRSHISASSVKPDLPYVWVPCMASNMFLFTEQRCCNFMTSIFASLLKLRCLIGFPLLSMSMLPFEGETNKVTPKQTWNCFFWIYFVECFSESHYTFSTKEHCEPCAFGTCPR